MKQFNETHHRIRAKVRLGLPLTARERASYLLFIATDEEAIEFIKNEKEVM